MNLCPHCGKKTKLRYYCRPCKKEHDYMFREAKKKGLPVLKRYSINGLLEQLDRRDRGLV